MRPFEYVSPTNKEQVATLLGERGSILAGGTDLLALMKDDVVAPARLVNIKQIDSLRGVSYQPGNGLRIGALTTVAEFAQDANVQRYYPVLADAAMEAASPQIRNLATMGGNMCQRPRCWYFRNGMGLMAKTPDGKSMVVAGDNRYAAILGNAGPAYFVSPSTLAPVLIALGAKVRLYSAKAAGSGVRELPLEKFFLIPKSENELEHDLKPGEMVIELVVPPPPQNLKAASYEVRQRAAFDWPLAQASVALEMDGSIVKSARVVLGHVAPIPWISPEAVHALVGKSISPETAMAAANAAVAQAKPLSHNKYKITLAKVAVKRAVLSAAGQSSRRCRMMLNLDAARFDTKREDLCPALRWKGQFIEAEHDPTVPPTNDGLFWCMHTQTCIGPDGELAEPGNCSSKFRACHGTGKCG